MRIPRRWHSIREQGVKKRPADSQSKCDLLIFLRTPSRAVHHPQEVGLYPTHAGVTEVFTERSMLSRLSACGWSVRLINNHGLLVELGEDVTAFLRPDFVLFQIRFRDQRHSNTRVAKLCTEGIDLFNCEK